MCYSRALRGYFKLWDEKGIITVFKDFNIKVAEELDKLYVASCGYLSPTIDPFQKPIEDRYHLSEKTAHEFLRYNLPIVFITKQGDNVPIKLLDEMAKHQHCFCEFTILSCDDEILKIFSPKGAKVEQQFKAVMKAVDRGLYTVVRMDPLFPGITDDEDSIRELVMRAKQEGAKHMIFSICDIDSEHLLKIFNLIREIFPDAYQIWKKIYVEKVGRDYDASIDYRRKIFKICRNICDEIGITMALCMEFEKMVGNKIMYRGLNDEFMTSKVCEGKIVPLYHRWKIDEQFKPISNCDGNCLAYAKGRGSCNLACNFPKMGKAQALRLEDYKSLRPSQMTLTNI
ncbi:MAG: hypothetical protein H3Z53_12480 [archaeon]|nr:hypothetical protein [archaeon]